MPLTTIYALAGACVVASGAPPNDVNPTAAKLLKEAQKFVSVREVGVGGYPDPPPRESQMDIEVLGDGTDDSKPKDDVSGWRKYVGRVEGGEVAHRRPRSTAATHGPRPASRGLPHHLSGIVVPTTTISCANTLAQTKTAPPQVLGQADRGARSATKEADTER